jgi:hypothetical protein
MTKTCQSNAVQSYRHGGTRIYRILIQLPQMPDFPFPDLNRLKAILCSHKD